MQNHHYDLYPLYSAKDSEHITCILKYIVAQGFTVFELIEDEIPGKLKLKNIIDHGICVCEKTIIFLSPNFIDDKMCKFAACAAVTRQFKNESSNSVIFIIIQPCNIPEYLQCLFMVDLEGCSSGDAMERVVAAVREPTLIKKEATDKNLSIFEIIVNCLKSSDCNLHCRYGRCNFICDGRKYSRLSKHIKQCPYFPVMCSFRFCNFTCERKDFTKHEENCIYKPLPCWHDGCEKHLPGTIMKGHEIQCTKRTVACTNRYMGCREMVKYQNLRNHLTKCLYNSKVCCECRMQVLESDVHLHDCSETRRIITYFSDDSFDFQKTVCPNIAQKSWKHGSTKAEHKHQCPEMQSVLESHVLDVNDSPMSSLLVDHRGLPDEQHNMKYIGSITNTTNHSDMHYNHATVLLSRRICRLNDSSDDLELLSSLFCFEDRCKMARSIFA